MNHHEKNRSFLLIFNEIQGQKKPFDMHIQLTQTKDIILSKEEFDNTAYPRQFQMATTFW